MSAKYAEADLRPAVATRIKVLAGVARVYFAIHPTDSRSHSTAYPEVCRFALLDTGHPSRVLSQEYKHGPRLVRVVM